MSTRLYQVRGIIVGAPPTRLYQVRGIIVGGDEIPTGPEGVAGIDDIDGSSISSFEGVAWADIATLPPTGGSS